MRRRSWIARTAVVTAIGVLAASCRGEKPSSDAASLPQGSAIAAAEIAFVNDRTEPILEWLALELPKRLEFPISKTQWKGLTLTIPQLRVETRPVALTLQLDEDPSVVPQEIAELSELFKPVLNQTAIAYLARVRSRLDVMSATADPPKVSGKQLSLTAATDLDPRAPDVDRLLTAVSDLTNGFAFDLVNLAVRVPGSGRWISK